MAHSLVFMGLPVLMSVCTPPVGQGNVFLIAGLLFCSLSDESFLFFWYVGPKTLTDVNLLMLSILVIC